MHRQRTLTILLVLYALASLVHFTHNAEFVREYPNLPGDWTRGFVYSAWLAMTAIGATGWLMWWRGWRLPGLALLAVYAALGLDSLGHYVLAPLSRHTLAMNATILVEVTMAGLVMVEVVRQMVLRPRSGTMGPH